MKNSKIIACVLYLFVLQTIHAQTVYQINYTFLHATDTVSYSSFFINFEDGTGLVRIKYRMPLSGEEVRVEMDAQEQYLDSKTTLGNTAIQFKLMNPRTVKGPSNAEFTAPVFWFKKGTDASVSPWGFTPSLTDPALAVNLFDSVLPVDSGSLSNKNFVLQFFSEQDAFYRSLFKTKTRDLTPKEKNTKIFLLAVGNIRDKKIGESCDKDLKRIVETFDHLQRYLGIPYAPNYPKVISGDNYNLKNVQQAINDLNPDTSDIVIFYFSGHGFRKDKDTRSGPWIDLRPKDDNTYLVNSMHLENIYDIIRNKKGRCNLVLADCCNDIVRATNPMAKPPSGTKGFIMNWNQENVRRLFLNPKKISIMAAAASPGQLSACNLQFGGFFSYFFKQSMENHFSYYKTDVSWDKVFKDAINQTVYKAKWTWCNEEETKKCDQVPFTIPSKLSF